MSTSVSWLSIVLFLPLAGAVALQLIPGKARVLIQGWTVAITLATSVIVGLLVLGFNNAAAGGGPLNMRYAENHEWIPAIGASYHVGMDGLAAWMLALNAGVFLLGAIVVSRRETERLRLFCGLLLVTETATAGVILAVDMLMFYVFWEAMLIPLYFLLSNFGEKNRGKATLKFVIYTVAGSLLMLVAIIYLKVHSPTNTFDLEAMLQNPGPAEGAVPFFGGHLLTPQQFAFIAFAAAFAIKLPLVPFHTWLPDLYESCPPAALMFFAGVVSKLGAFGFIRYAITLFPHEAHDYQGVMLTLAVISILYGALMALSETDIKRIVAYSSISHLGFVALGIFSLNSAGINGAIIQMVNHGIIIAGLFLVLGIIEQRTGTRDRHELAGLEKRMPYLYFFFLVITLAGLGMPGMNSFVGEFTIMLGAFQTYWLLAVLAGGGVILACWYMLRLHQGLMHEPLQPRAEQVRDIGVRDGWVLLPLVALMIGLGVYPHPVSDMTRTTAEHYVTLLSPIPVPVQIIQGDVK